MKQITVNECLRRVAISIGQTPGSDPFSDTNEVMVQLKGLLADAGDELVQMFDWEVLKKQAQLTLTGAESYSLPEDFDRMIPQTHWNRTTDLPVAGPLSSQDWQYLLGRDLASNTIYASFRQREGLIYIYPSTLTGEDIYYEYISKNWVFDESEGETADEPTDGADLILFDSSLIRNYLRAKFYEAKGLETISAEQVASVFYFSRIAKDEGGPILNAGNGARGYPYLDGMRNVPDTGYGF